MTKDEALWLALQTLKMIAQSTAHPVNKIEDANRIYEQIRKGLGI